MSLIGVLSIRSRGLPKISTVGAVVDDLVVRRRSLMGSLLFRAFGLVFIFFYCGV